MRADRHFTGIYSNSRRDAYCPDVVYVCQGGNDIASATGSYSTGLWTSFGTFLHSATHVLLSSPVQSIMTRGKLKANITIPQYEDTRLRVNCLVQRHFRRDFVYFSPGLDAFAGLEKERSR